MQPIYDILLIKIEYYVGLVAALPLLHLGVAVGHRARRRLALHRHRQAVLDSYRSANRGRHSQVPPGEPRILFCS